MKLSVAVRTATITEIDVEFPCYSQFGGDDYDVYRRLNDDGAMFIIHENSDGYEFTVEKYDIKNAQFPEELFGLGDYKSTEAKFNNALNEAKAFIARFE